MPRTYRLDDALSARAATRLRRGLDSAGWRPASDADSKDAGLLWTQGPPHPREFARLETGRSINHFPGFAAFGDKGHLHRNLSSAARLAGEGMGRPFHPRSYTLPDETVAWQATAIADPEAVWIVKPRRGGQGQGIRLVVDPEVVDPAEECVAQEYVDRPHLLDGRKYVLRFWVLVRSLDPLVCYLHENGVFKTTARPFRPARETFEDLPRHLTNPSIQAADDSVPLGSLNDDLGGYARRLREAGVDPAPVLGRVREILIRAVIACRDQALLTSRGAAGTLDGCFELLGPDILIDRDLTPWLLELNTFPSLEVSDEAEPRAAAIVRAAKDEMVADAARLIDTPLHDPPERAGRFVRVWPGPDAARFTRCFSVLRPRDRALAARCAPDPPDELVVVGELVAAGGVTARVDEDDLIIEHEGRAFALNALAATVWLGVCDGLTPSEIVREIATVFPAHPVSRIEDDVWDLLTVWVRKGLIVRAAPSGSREVRDTQPPAPHEKEEERGEPEIRPARSA